MLEGRWNIASSQLVSDGDKQVLLEKLNGKVTSAGDLLVKSQTARTQLANKEEVVKKINRLVENALLKKKARISTKPTKASKERRVQSKKTTGEKKHYRKKVIPGDY